jgi:DNA-binding NarL/FixJ family response regulator
MTIAAVVPVWLQDALAVLLKSEQDVRLVACTATVQTLLLLSLEQAPDLVLLKTDEHDQRATDQVRQIKAVWPASQCLALVEHNGQGGLVRAVGADEVLPSGASAQQLLASIRQRQPH